MNNDVKIVETDKYSKNGQYKCTKCGTTDISFDIEKSVLKCNFCRHEFVPEKVVGLEADIKKLEGKTITSGLQDIVEDAENIITLKCTSCGAEVVIDTSEAVQARCHWCRNTLSINEQVPNGAIPDEILPFKISKAEAEEQLKKFIKQRRFFADRKFLKEFTADNIMGVYFPYVAVDVNSHALFKGEALYDGRGLCLYKVEREFDLAIEGLTLEASLDKSDNECKNKTNNIINSIMPFDIENCVKWNANYLKGYSSEKRDINIDYLESKIEVQAKDIARNKINKTLEIYDSGVHWKKEKLQIKGKQCKIVYLPVWLYSYSQENYKKQKTLHYLAVNARTNETMGSVPINKKRLISLFYLTGIISISLGFFISYLLAFISIISAFFFLLILFGILEDYRNTGVRHFYEKETKVRVFNIRKVDKLIKKIRINNSDEIMAANNKKVEGGIEAPKIY